MEKNDVQEGMAETDDKTKASDQQPLRCASSPVDVVALCIS